MKSAVAIKKYIEQDPNGSKVPASELTAFKKACTPEEWAKMGQNACEILNEEWEPTQ